MGAFHTLFALMPEGSGFSNFRRLFNRRNLSAWMVLLVCLLMTVSAWYGLGRLARQNAQHEFELHTRDVIESIKVRLRQHEQILLGGAGLFDASASVERQEWHDYVERLNLGLNYPGIQGVGFSKLIKPEELDAHIAATRRDGFPAYTVWPSGKRQIYTSIVYLEPFSGRNLAAFGFDMMSEEVRSSAMRAAANSGRTAISGKVKLVQETHGKVQAGFLMYVPVYRRGAPLATPAQRWDALVGFVYSPYRVDDLMSNILEGRQLEVDFSIYDGGEEAETSRMYTTLDDAASPGYAPALSVVHHLREYGQQWTLRLSSRPEFDASIIPPLNSVILLLGSGISLLLFSLFSISNFRRERAEEIAIDMTAEIRSNEHKLRQSEGRLQAILDGAEHLVISTDISGVIQSFNRAAERHLGYRAEELIGKKTPALFHVEEEVSRVADELARDGVKVDNGFEVFVARARANPFGETREWTYVRKDGSIFPVSLTVTALRDESGEINAYLGIATDIAYRNRIAEVQEHDAVRMAAILDNVLDGIITINQLGEIETFNKASSAIFGYSENEVIGRNVKMLMPDPYHSEHDGYLNNYVTTGHKKIIGIGRQVVGRRKDGTTFAMELAVSEMHLGDKLMFTGIVRDITERVKVDRMKSEFISTVSHELRTPLTSIRGSLALIIGGVAGELPAKARPLVDIAHKNSERLILLVNDILDMEKIEAGKMEFDLQPVELMPLLTHAMEGNRAYAEQYKVSYELESEVPGVWLRVDANRLMQVFANLLSNAAKFSPAGEKVLIAVTRTDHRIRVAVKNRGPGIPDEFKSRIFQKFAQADSSDTRKKGGTGLGLSITKAIVEQMGGSIGFESQPEVLTEFHFEFPEWLEPLVEPASARTEQNGTVACIGFKVLHVEDDSDVFQVVSGVLRDIAETTLATNLNQAREMLAQGGYNLVILDLDLAGQPGKELLPLLKQAVPQIPVVVFSAQDVAAEEVREADAVLLKSRDDNTQILATVKRLLGVV